MRKAIFAGAVVLLLGIGSVALAHPGNGLSEDGDAAHRGSFLEEVLTDLVSDGTITLDQLDAITAALQEKREVIAATRQEAKEQLESFWEDDVLTEDEINQLAFADRILEMDGVSDALADGQITRQEMEDLRPEVRSGHGRRGLRGHGGGRR